MKVGVLGRPALYSSGEAVSLVGAREAALLAVLTSQIGRTVRAEVLEDELWEGRPVSDAALRVAVNRLRNRFVELTGASPLRSEPAGYRLVLEPREVDATVFEDLVAHARIARAEGDPTAAVGLIDRGESLWRSDAYDGFTQFPSVRVEHDRLHELRCSALETRAAALIDVGELAEAVSSLQQLTGRFPVREPMRALQMVALARLGRPRDALLAFTELQCRLDDELGVTPSVELRQLERAIADHRPAGELVVHALLGPTVRPAPPRAVQPTRRRIVGRDAELARLDVAASTCSSARLVCISGESGIGKTALVDTFAGEHRATGALALSGRCDRHAAVPLRPILEAFDEVFRGDDLPTDELTSMLQASSERADHRVDSFDLRRYHVLTLFGDLIGAAATAGPVVLVIDDAQWIDSFSASLIEYLLIDRAELPLLVVATVRRSLPGDHPLAHLVADLSVCGASDHISIGGLSAHHIADVLDPSLTERQVELVHRASGGNPMYALQLEHLLGPDFRSTPSALSADLTQLCLARLDPLSQDAVRVLEAAAVLGHVATATDVAAILETSRSAIAGGLSEAQREGLLEPAAGLDRFAFVHGLIRQVSYDHIEPGRRAHLHWSAAQLLMTGESLARSADIADHLAESRPLVSDEEIAGAALMAGREAVTLGAYGDALRFFRVVIELGSPTPEQAAAARFGLGLGLAAGSALADSSTTLTRAIDDALSIGDWELAADGLIARSRLGLSSSIPEADAEAGAVDQLLAKLPGDDHGRRGHLLFWKCELLMNVTPGEAASALDRAGEHAERLDDPTLDGLIEYARIRLADSSAVDPARCMSDAGRLRQQAETNGLRSVAVRAGLILQGARLRSGAVAGARAEMHGLVTQADRAHDPGLVLQHRLAGVAMDLASTPMDVADAQSVAVTQNPAPGLENLALAARFTHLSIIRREQHRLRELEPLLIGALVASPRRFTRPLVAAARIECGDLDGATEQLGIFSDELGQLGCDWTYLATLALAAEAAAHVDCAALADPIEARLTELVPQVVVACNTLLVIGHVDRYLGLLAHLRGDLDLAVERFDTARRIDGANGLTLWSAWAAHGEAAARLERGATGDGDRAIALLGTAGRIAVEFGSTRLSVSVDSLDTSVS